MNTERSGAEEAYRKLSFDYPAGLLYCSWVLRLYFVMLILEEAVRADEQVTRVGAVMRYNSSASRAE